MTNSPFIQTVADSEVEDRAVTREAIIYRARELWEELGCPENCDLAIWLEAEAEIRAIQEKRYRHPTLEFKEAMRARAKKEEPHCV